MICSRDVERRHELAVVVVEDDVLDADAAAGFLRLGAAPRGERAAAFGLMTRIAVGHRDEPHAMAERGIFRRGAAGALIAVVGMRAKRDDVQLAVGARRLRALGGGSMAAAWRPAHRCQRRCRRRRASETQRAPQDDRVRGKALHDHLHDTSV